MSRKIKVGEVEYTVRELTIEEGLDLSPEGDSKTKTFQFATKCIEPKLTVEEFKNLPFREGLKLITAVNEENGLTDFQNPMTVTPKN